MLGWLKLQSRRRGEGTGDDEGRESIEVAALRNTVNPAELGFLTTAELEPLDRLIGQQRGLDAVQVGLNLRSDNFNIFAVGPLGAGKLRAVMSILNKVVANWAVPQDLVYLHNFQYEHRPKALALRAGQGPQFARMMVDVVDELRIGLPAIFDSEDYVARRRVIELSFESDQEDAIDNLMEQAMAKDIQIVRTPTGFTMVPYENGDMVAPEVFAGKPLNERRIIEARIHGFEAQLSEILSRLPAQQKERAQKLQALNEEMAQRTVKAALETVRRQFSSNPEVSHHLDEVESDLVRHVGLFLGEESAKGGQGPIEVVHDARFRRYLVNVLVTTAANAQGHIPKQGGPIVKEVNPTLSNLLGSIETHSERDGPVTDFMRIKAGALHHANGGVLLLDARKLLENSYAWEGLKRALVTREIKIDSPIDDGSVTSPVRLVPDAVPLNLKVVLFGDRSLYYKLNEMDPEFSQIFKIQAEFDERIERSETTETEYARLIAGICKRRGLKAVDAVGVARLIEQSSRQANDAEKLDINFYILRDILEEANYWADEAGRNTTTHEDILKTLNLRDERASHMKHRAIEHVIRDVQKVQTSGEVVGQINGLSVVDLGDTAFGRANRITARVRMGSGRVIDIEREVELGGPLHSKGVMILWGYLAGTFASDVPLALSASLVFEQSYHGVDGDSASAAELFALLSALAKAPIRQGVAVTGSVNQMGEMQAVGGVNEKIEGFFDICKARGLTGDQGVIIPHANRLNLMLKEDVLKACGRGQFHIWAIRHVNEGLSILTGQAAGLREKNGQFTPGSLNHAVDQRLLEFAQLRRGFTKAGP